MNGKVTYRQQYTRCGKERCRKCKEGNGHGPYWYAYWSENGRTVSKYIGIHLPSSVSVELTQRALSGTEMKTRDAPPDTVAIVAETAVSPSKQSAAQFPQNVPFQLESQGLRIYTLGQLRIERFHNQVWSPIANRVWQRRRTRVLLGCLLSNPGRRLGREQVMEALWPDLDIETAANRLNGAVHELRQILEPGIGRPASSQMLRLERDILVLADRANIWVDAEAFEQLINESHQIGTQNLRGAEASRLERLLGEANALYNGDYLLEELYAEWAAPRREALKRHWIGLQLCLSELWEAQGKTVNAMAPLHRLLAADPTNETAVQRLMLLLTLLDRRGEALNAYDQLAMRLRQTYESEPLPETSALYEKLRQGQDIKSLALRPSITIVQKSEETAASIEEPTGLPEEQGAEKHTDEPPFAALARDTFELTPAALIAAKQFGRANQSPLVGREQEMYTLRQMLLSLEQHADQRSGPATTNGPTAMGAKSALHIALLTGEAGIGKTRLAEELSHEAVARGWAVAWSRAYEQEGTIPYRPWIEVLRVLLPLLPIKKMVAAAQSRGQGESYTAPYTPTALEKLSALLPELRGLLPPGGREYPPLPPEQERLHLWEATLEMLSTLSQSLPLLLVLDDLHWTDDSSRELLAYLLRHLRDQRVLLIGTCRDLELAPNDSLRTLIADLRREQAVLTVAVQPLSVSQIGSLIAHLPENVVQHIQTQAGGNPFFAEEMARVSETSFAAPSLTTAESQQDAYTRSLTISSLPEGIAAVLERRLGKLSDECLALLSKAAVLGGAFELGPLLSMAGEHTEDTLLDLLEEALRAGLLTEEGAGTRITYHFWHPLIVSHLYDRLSAARRAQMHRRAAKALLETNPGREKEVAAAVTHHLSKGGGEPAQIAYYAELAANQAYSLAAYAEARQYYLLTMQTFTGDASPTNARETLSTPDKAARSASADPLHLAHLLELVCECDIVQGDFEEARTFYERILDLRNQRAGTLSAREQQQEAQFQAMIWREIGRTWSWNGNYEQAHQCYQYGKQVLQEAGITSGTAWACVSLEYGRIRVLEGNYDEARRYILESLAMLEKAIEERKNASLDEQQENRGNGQLPPHSLQTQIERVIAGDPLETGRARELLGLIAANIGQYAEALQYLHEALEIFKQHDLVAAMVKVCGNLGAVYLTRAENALAQPYMRQALELAERIGNLPMIAFVTGNLGEMETRRGNLLQAREWFRTSLQVAERTNEPEHICWCCVALAGTLQDLGQFEEAAVSIRRALTTSRAMRTAKNIGGALVALGDFRITQAIIAGRIQGANIDQEPAQLSTNGKRLLLRARSTLRRALSTEGLEVEAAVEGRLLLASAYYMLGDQTTAQHLAQQTLTDAATYELTRLHARALRLLGRILAAQRQYEQADGYFEEALSVFRQHEMHLDYARALHGYAMAMLARAAPDSCLRQKGLEALREARNIFAECHALADLRWIEQELQADQSEIVEA
jgi:predicted ATPase/DNA-binding SARP family transcriptional activator